MVNIIWASQSTCLDQLDPVYVQRVQNALNARPRKTLGWKTPAQVLSEFNGVALQFLIRHDLNIEWQNFTN